MALRKRQQLEWTCPDAGLHADHYRDHIQQSQFCLTVPMSAAYMPPTLP